MSKKYNQCLLDMARYGAQNGKMCFFVFYVFYVFFSQQKQKKYGQDLMSFFKRHDRAMLQLPDNH